VITIFGQEFRRFAESNKKQTIITIITITIKRSQYSARSSGDLLRAINKFDFNIFNLTLQKS
jgi:hypothetical protein